MFGGLDGTRQLQRAGLPRRESGIQCIGSWWQTHMGGGKSSAVQSSAGSDSRSIGGILLHGEISLATAFIAHVIVTGSATIEAAASTLMAGDFFGRI